MNLQNEPRPSPVAPAPATRRSTGNSPAGAAVAPIPPQLLTRAEHFLGADLSDVTLHPGSDLPARGNAVACARGSEIHLAPGAPAVRAPARDDILAHELAHVVQQRAGRVRPTGYVGGLAINQDPALEADAEWNAKRILDPGPGTFTAPVAPSRRWSSSRATVQFHHTVTLEDTTKMGGEIYAIYDNTTNDIVYVGQTCMQIGTAKRYLQHVAQDTDRPWHQTGHNFTAKILEAFDPDEGRAVTKLELTAAEEYWWEHYGGLTGGLENRKQPLTLKRFNMCKSTAGFRGKKLGFPDGDNWKPKQ